MTTINLIHNFQHPYNQNFQSNNTLDEHIIDKLSFALVKSFIISFFWTKFFFHLNFFVHFSGQNTKKKKNLEGGGRAKKNLKFFFVFEIPWNGEKIEEKNIFFQKKI